MKDLLFYVGTAAPAGSRGFSSARRTPGRPVLYRGVPHPAGMDGPARYPI